MPDFVKITTDARIKRIPAPDIIVSFSANTRIPIRVATIGSIVAMIPALLASTLSRPSVYDRKGITAVIKAVRKQKKIRNPGQRAIVCPFAGQQRQCQKDGRGSGPVQKYAV